MPPRIEDHALLADTRTALPQRERSLADCPARSGTSDSSPVPRRHARSRDGLRHRRGFDPSRRLHATLGQGARLSCAWSRASAAACACTWSSAVRLRLRRTASGCAHPSRRATRGRQCAGRLLRYSRRARPLRPHLAALQRSRTRTDRPIPSARGHGVVLERGPLQPEAEPDSNLAGQRRIVIRRRRHSAVARRGWVCARDPLPQNGAWSMATVAAQMPAAEIGLGMAPKRIRALDGRVRRCARGGRHRSARADERPHLRAGSARWAPGLGCARLCARRCCRLVAAAGEPVRAADDRCGRGLVSLEPLVVQLCGAVHDRDRCRPASCRGLPARVPCVSERSARRVVRTRTRRSRVCGRVGVQFVGMALDGFGPDNLLAVTARPDTAYTLLRVQLVVLSAFCLAGIAILFVRRRRGRPSATPRERAPRRLVRARPRDDRLPLPVGRVSDG